MSEPTFTVFKRLTNYDITKKLGLPSKILQHIPIPQGTRSVYLRVTDSRDRVWPFKLYTRPRGRPNPVLRVGWLDFARAKRLEAGDKLTISGRQDGELQIQVVRGSYVTYQGGPAELDVENFH